MCKYIHVCFLCYICLVAFILHDMSIVNGSSHNVQRRYLSLRNMSNFFFTSDHSNYIKPDIMLIERLEFLVDIIIRYVENLVRAEVDKKIKHLRFNVKANMVPWTQIFAQVVGFRMNWNQPPDTFHPWRNHYIHRRTIYNHIETLLDKNGLDGFQCVRRAICEMKTTIEPRKIYHKLLKMVFRHQSSATEKWHNTTSEDCAVSLSTCPFSFLDVSLYTDTV